MVAPPSRESPKAVDPQPRILVVAPDDARAGPLCQGLDALGWRTVTARGAGGALSVIMDLPVEAVVLDARLDDPEGLAEALRGTAQPRRLPILAIAAPESLARSTAFDLVMTVTPHPAQAALRLEQLFRAALAEEEIALREATFAARGVPLARDVSEAPVRVLAAGPPDHRFLALSNALDQEGAEVIAAPTAYTAFDYLHERAFDAAVLWGGEDHTAAQSIAAGMKRNTRLYHIPVVLYLNGQAEMNLGELFGRGFADVAASDTPEEETARRVMALARTHRRHQAVRRALETVRGSALADAATGLFTRELFASHLARVAEASRERRRPLSVCVLKVTETPELSALRAGGWVDRALPQIGAMLSRLIRVEDTAARLSPEVFALALPATRAAQARIAAERIAAVIGCTAFDAGSGRAPFVVGFDIGAAELQAGEGPAQLLERASADLRR